MKNKKIIAFALTIGIITSSFNGIIPSYAKYKQIYGENSILKYSTTTANDITNTNNITSDNNSNNLVSDSNNNNENIESKSVEAPEDKITQTEADIPTESVTPSKNINSNGNGEVIYKGKRTTTNPKSYNINDQYNIKEKDIEKLIKEGYTLQEIFEADDIGNEIKEDPEVLLKKKKESNKTLKEVKDDVVKERKTDYTKKLKNKYKNEYAKLIKANLKETDIISLLGYLEVNNVKLTDDLISQYKADGEKLLSKPKDKQNKKVSDTTKEKYQLSDKDIEGLTQDEIDTLVYVAQNTNKPLKDLIKSYKKSKKN